MIKLLSALVICAILAAGCSSLTAPTSTPTPAYYPDLSISMVQTAWGYTNYRRINASGYVSYEGSSYYEPIKQKKSAQITPQQIEELVAAINKANVLGLEDWYCPTFVHVADRVQIDLSISLNGQYKHISDCAACNSSFQGASPMTLCELENKIDTIVNSDQWANPTP